MDAQTIIAKRIAQELRSGMLVNLGIGIPTLVASHVPKTVSVFFQSENGLIGTGPIPEEGMAHPTLTDAAGHPVTPCLVQVRSTALSPSASFVAGMSI
jgi:acetate CoA/acetoacetate CoA-transferase beta subunit